MHPTWKRLNKKMLEIGGFDIANNSPAATFEEVTERVRHHIRWFRENAEERAQAMDRALQDEEWRMEEGAS